MRFNREFYKSLDRWRDSQDRRPLLVRGARQVGKSFGVREWAQKHFDAQNWLEINLEERADYRRLFEKDLNVERIIDELEFSAGVNLRSSKSLLFIDEIQASSQALTSLRYFYERIPELHVIAAGSLIDFVLSEISFPVGRIDTLYVQPLSFFEFLRALGKGGLVDRIETVPYTRPLPETIHEELSVDLKKYFRVGGMPDAVRALSETNDLQAVGQVHERLFLSYKSDFAKFSKEADWDLLELAFSRVPFLVGDSRVKYSRIDKDCRSYKVKKALRLLAMANLITPIYAASGEAVPLAQSADIETFKLLFLDIGLMQFGLGFNWAKVEADAQVTDLARGALAEQFVGQELCASKSASARYQPHYWYNHSKGSDAELDYLIEQNGEVVPLEVKSGVQGGLKSLDQFAKRFSCQRAIVVSGRPYDGSGIVEWVPIYCVSRL
jgi:uncharacterized protein